MTGVDGRKPPRAVPPAPADGTPPPPSPAPATGRSRRGVWIGIAVVAAAAVVGVWVVRGRSAAKPAAEGGGRRGGAGGAGDRPVSVTVATVVARDLPITVDGLGTVTPLQTVGVRSRVDGQLVRVGFREGQAVRKGDLLAEVDARPFAIQLHQAEAALARDQAQLRGAERNLERYAAVSAERLIPQQQADDQKALVDQLRGTVEADKAQIESARLQLTYARITSPLDGVTGLRLIDPGNIVHASDANPIVIVTQMDPIAVLFTLPQDDLPRVIEAQRGAAAAGAGPGGQAAPPLVEARTRDRGELLGQGQLALVDNQINQATATIRLKALFPNPARTLWPNQFVSARLRLAVRKGALVIPAAAVQRGPQGTFVYVREKGEAGADRAAVRAITVDGVEGAEAIVGKGIEAGDVVVVEGQSQLKPGARMVVRDGAARGGGEHSGERGGGGKREGGGRGDGRAGGPGGAGAGAEP